jgi:hypothetical protein
MALMRVAKLPLALRIALTAQSVALLATCGARPPGGELVAHPPVSVDYGTSCG